MTPRILLLLILTLAAALSTGPLEAEELIASFPREIRPIPTTERIPNGSGSEGGGVITIDQDNIRIESLYRPGDLGLRPGDVITGLSLRLDGNSPAFLGASLPRLTVKIGEGKDTLSPFGLNFVGGDPFEAVGGEVVLGIGDFPFGSSPNDFGPTFLFDSFGRFSPYEYQGGNLLIQISIDRADAIIPLQLDFLTDVDNGVLGETYVKKGNDPASIIKGALAMRLQLGRSDYTIPDGYEGRLYLRGQGGDGGSSRIAWILGPNVASIGASGPGASVDAEFNVGNEANEIPGGSTLRFIVGRKGESFVDLEAGFDDSASAAGGAGTAVYISVPDSPRVCPVNSTLAAPGSLCTDSFQCGIGRCRQSNRSQCSSDSDCGTQGDGTQVMCEPVSVCDSGFDLLLGAGGGGGGFAGLISTPIPVAPAPIWSAGDYGQFDINGSDGGGLGPGDGGPFIASFGGFGGEDTSYAGGGGGTGEDGQPGPSLRGGGGRADPVFVSRGGNSADDSPSGGFGWGGGGFATREDAGGGGGGGLAGGGAGGLFGGGGGGGSYCSPQFDSTYCRYGFKALQKQVRMPLDGMAEYGLSPDAGTRIIEGNSVVPGDFTIRSGENWVVQTGVILTLEGDFSIEPGGSLNNSGLILVKRSIQNVGTITNNPGGRLMNVITGVISNTGTIENSGEIYACSRPLQGSAPTGTPAVAGCVLSPQTSSSSAGGKEVCEATLRGTWSGLDACQLGNLQLDAQRTLVIDAGATLFLEGVLTNNGSIINNGVVNNENGILSDCASPPPGFSGILPTPNAFVPGTCIANPDRDYCENVLEGVFNVPFSRCVVVNHTVDANETRNIPPGFILNVTGILNNNGTINNNGEIYNQAIINNNPGATLNNFGALLTNLDLGQSIIFNEGEVVNFGAIDIDTGGAVFDNNFSGFLSHQCGSQYTGSLPINSEPGSVQDNCVTPESTLCTSELGGTWDSSINTCTIGDYSVDNDLTIAPGFTLVVSGSLINLSTLNNKGTIVFEDYILNLTGAVFNNFGTLRTDLFNNGQATIQNLGSVDNYGSIIIEAGGGVFDNDNAGILTYKCFSTYTGELPLNNNPPGGTVTEPDCQDSPVVTLTGTDTQGAEPGADTLTFRLSRSRGPADVQNFVRFALGGDAELVGGFTSGGDYTVSDEVLTDTFRSGYVRVEMPPFTQALDLVFTPQPDNLVEGDETLTLTLLPFGGYTIDPLTADPQAGIIADDPAIVSVAVTDGSADEAGADPGVIRFSRRGGDISQSLTVFFVRGGSASFPADFTAAGLVEPPLPASVIIPAGRSSFDLVITPRSDALTEGTETVVITLQDVDDSYAIDPGSVAPVTVNIADDASPPPVISAVAIDDEAAESDGVATNEGLFRFTRTGAGLDRSILIYFSLAGTAVVDDGSGPNPEQDYGVTGASGSDPYFLFMSAGQSSADVRIIPFPDSRYFEGDETVIATLRDDVSPQIYPVILDPDATTATITIIDYGSVFFKSGFEGEAVNDD